MEVNIDYIASVISNGNGQLKYVEVKIPKQNLHILGKMDDMREDPNCSILDLQESVDYLIISRKEHNVCIPHEYFASYIHAPKFPAKISYSDYVQLCADKEKEFLKAKEQAEKKGETVDVDQELYNFRSLLKSEYYEAVSNYVAADEYMTVVEAIKNNGNYKMYSSENIGWTTFIYPISDNVKFEIRTNFGYGRSAYFRVNLLYKGIQIIPYSDVVKYYYANMLDFCQFTRQYSPRRHSWPLSLNFVVETSNLAHANPEEFVKTWIKNELEEMMKGLRRINYNVEAEIEKFKKEIHPGADDFLCVRNINEHDIEDYKAFPKEMAPAYKAYKISGALHFLENLSQLSEVYVFVSDYIDELKRINIEILPEIETALGSIDTTLTDLHKELDRLNIRKNVIDKKIEPFIKTLEELKREKDQTFWWSITQNFKKLNPSYGKMLADKEEIQKQISKIAVLIYKRDNFKHILEESRAIIIEKAIA